MRIAATLFILLGLLTVVYLVVVPEATEVGRRPLPDDGPVPARFSQATRCYRLTFSPAGFERERVIRLRDLDQRDGGETRVPWSMAGPDSIQVTVASRWYVGYTLRLSVRSDTPSGRAWTWSDIPYVAPGASVRATPVACSA